MNCHFKKYILFICILFLTVRCVDSNDGNLMIYDVAPPEENRFTIEVLSENVNQPMQLVVLEDGKVIFIEKVGTIKMYDPQTNTTKVIGDIPVNVYYSEEYTTAGGKYDADDGMHGIALDPNFSTNNFIYLYYSPKSEEPKSVLARYTLKNEKIDENSRKILMEWKTQRNRCCHFGGGMVFDADGNLLFAIGDNTANGNAPANAPRREVYDPQRTAGNTNDYRGSILRIHPKNDGTYSIPEGNLFPKDLNGTKPEIYVMGVRNPMRLSIDSETGWLYWGEVGPSTEEFNQAKNAGNFGWPYFIANNEPFLSIDTLGNKSDPNNIVNTSKLNTGISELPSPPVPALVWYSREKSEDFPIPGTGSLSAMGGPIYRLNDFENPKRPFPSYYDGKWFVTDFVRGWILVIELDEEGNYKSMEHFLPNTLFKGPMDMKFGPDGDLYVLEYSRQPYVEYPADARLIRIKYNSGNRSPVAHSSINEKGGPIPFNLELDGSKSYDPDKDPLNFYWEISSDKGYLNILEGSKQKITVSEPGNYKAKLIVTDDEGLKDSSYVNFYAGNSPPVVDIKILSGGNKSIYFDDEIMKYNISISDVEDNQLGGLISDNIEIWTGYLLDDYKMSVSEVSQILDTTEGELLPIKELVGRNILQKDDCGTCHLTNSPSIGPSLNQISDRYDSFSSEDFEYLTNKIIKGGSGAWGSVEMPAHPSLSVKEANLIVNYILGLNNKTRYEKEQLNGTIKTPADDSSKGNLLLYASYLDSGNDGVLPIKTSEMISMKPNVIPITHIDEYENMEMYFPGYNEPYAIPTDSLSFIKLSDIDLTGLKKVQLDVSNIYSDQSWNVTLRIDKIEGTVIGTADISKIKSEGELLLDVNFDSVIGNHDLLIIFQSDKFNKDNSINIKKISLF